MSDEIAQAPPVESVTSNAVIKDVPNSHSASTTTAAAETYGIPHSQWPVDAIGGGTMLTGRTDIPASSTAGPKTQGSESSTAPSTAAQRPSSKEAPTSNSVIGNGVTAPFVKTSGPPTVLLEGQQAPAIPIRLSSNSNLQSSTVSPASEQASGDQATASPPTSTGSLKAGSRGGSVASSKQSRKVVAKTPPGTSNDAAAANPPSTPHAEKARKRGVSKFLSYLNCCSPPENANAVEADHQAVPAKKVKLLQPRGRQPAPVVKPSASAADSSVGESKETADENIGGPPYSELTPAAKPKMLNQRLRETVPSITEKAAVPDSSGQNVNEKADPVEPGTGSQPLPPLTATDLQTGPNDSSEPAQQPATVPSTSGDADAIEPPGALPPDQNVSENATAADDRTPKQEEKDSDVPMVDAPPIEPPPDEKSKSSDGRDDNVPPVNLPPPPPRNGQDRAAGGVGRSPSNAAAPNEKQQWLLPPLQPRFRGKKCLVLDLDETLVHSSFKVTFHARGDPSDSDCS